MAPGEAFVIGSEIAAEVVAQRELQHPNTLQIHAVMVLEEQETGHLQVAIATELMSGTALQLARLIGDTLALVSAE